MINIVDSFSKYKKNIAYINDDKSITYEELIIESSKYANLLKKQGTEPVIIYGHKKIEMIVAIISCLIAKRAYIPIDVCTPINRIEKIIEITGAELIIKTEDLEIDSNIETINIEELVKYEDNLEKTISNSIAYIIFTSGSTGEPKGVPISYANLENFVNWISHIEPFIEYKNVKILNQASFSFDLSVADLYYSLLNGHTLVGLNQKFEENYNSIFDVMKKQKINVSFTTPTFIKLCLLNPDFNCDNFSNLKCLYFCGEKLEKTVVQKIFKAFPKIKIINAYGPTEATSAVSSIVIKPEMLNNLETMPVGNMNNLATHISIVQNEIILKGKSVFNGYLGFNSESFYKENGINCYRTGDLGYVENNLLFCKGRKDNQIKYKGYRIELFDIETNMLTIDGVTDCAVVCKKNEEGIVKFIKAFVVLEENIDEAYVKMELGKLLPKYMIPKIIKKVEKLPINKNGKIDRKALMSL